MPRGTGGAAQSGRTSSAGVESRSMIAYLITAYDEFDAVADLVGRLYDPRDLYCICVSSNNTAAISEALDQLNGLTALPNIRIIATRAAPHGGILENLLTAIDFCLKFDQNWQSLILLTGSHIAVASPSAIRERISEQFRDKIVLEAGEHPKELAADTEILERLFDDPFRLDADKAGDNVVYNPFTYSRLSLERAGTSYYVRPGAMRAGWSRSSAFVGNLFQHTFVPEHNEVHVDLQPRIVRRLLEKFFEDRPMSACLAWGIMPRDFCGFCLDSPQAQTYFGLIYNCFAAEEPFFATLALDPIFRERIVQYGIVVYAPRPGHILTMQDVDDAVAQGRLFARKSPAEESGREFRAEAYARLGIPNQLDIARLRKPRAMGYRELLPELLRQNLRFAGTRFTMGIFTHRQLAEFTVLPDLTLEYHQDSMEVKEPAGRQWRWRAGGYDAFSASGDAVARFDGFRIHGGRLLVFGNWPWAEALTLACVADIVEMLSDPPLNSFLYTADGLGQVRLDEHAWRFWLSDREATGVRFHPDGTIHLADGTASAAGYWRVDDGRLLTFGLDDMPVALFDQISGEHGEWNLAGATWGRQLPVEPCNLASVTRRSLVKESDNLRPHTSLGYPESVESDARAMRSWQRRAQPDHAPSAQRLDLIGVKYGTDKSSLFHDYLNFYEKFVEAVHDEPIVLLEIGVLRGQSVQMWQEYFPQGRIIGADIDTNASKYADDRITIVIVDQSKVVDLIKLGREFGPFDIVVDDGSHCWDHQTTTLQCLFPYVKPGGLYILEDIHTSFGEQGYPFKGSASISAFQYLSRLVEYTVADEFLDIDGEDDAFIRSYASHVESVTFYRHTAVVRRRRSQNASTAMRDPWPLLAEDRQSTATRPSASMLVHLAFKGDVINERQLLGGVRGSSLTIQGFAADLAGVPPTEFQYRALLNDHVWSEWVGCGEFVGSRGAGVSIRGFAVRLGGELAAGFECRCAGTFTGVPDVIEVAEGEVCCAPGSPALDAMHIILRRRGDLRDSRDGFSRAAGPRH